MRFTKFALAALPPILWLAMQASVQSAEQPHPMLPRYRLKLGQELVYRVTPAEDLRDSNSARSPRERSQWHVTVVRENDDGSWRLFIRTEMAFFNPDGRERLKRDSFGYCDLRPDGSYSLDERTAIFKMLLPYELFCRLPDTPDELQGEWSYQPPVMGHRHAYRLAKRDGPRLQIVATQKDDYSDGHYQLVRSYDFDQERALVTTIVLESKDWDSGQPKSRRTISLTSETENDAAWTALFFREGQRYLDANAKWISICFQGIRARNLEDCRQARTEARAVLAAGREQSQLDYFQVLFETNLQAHDKEEAAHLAAVKNRERYFSAAPGFSSSWQAKAFDGNTFRLADHRGKVVVLYFWSTGCEYCMLAAPMISELAADYKDRDVSVVGMFVRYEDDDEGAVPRHATTAAYRDFPHVEAREIYALYQLEQHGTPTTLVLDQEGKIREAFSGYSADLADCVRHVVSDLLADTEHEDRPR